MEPICLIFAVISLEGIKLEILGSLGVTLQLAEELRDVGVDGRQGGGAWRRLRLTRLWTIEYRAGVMGAEMWRCSLLDPHRLGHTDLH